MMNAVVNLNVEYDQARQVFVAHLGPLNCEPGAGMHPACHPGDILVLDRTAMDFHEDGTHGWFRIPNTDFIYNELTCGGEYQWIETPVLRAQRRDATTPTVDVPVYAKDWEPCSECGVPLSWAAGYKREWPKYPAHAVLRDEADRAPAEVISVLCKRAIVDGTSTYNPWNYYLQRHEGCGERVQMPENPNWDELLAEPALGTTNGDRHGNHWERTVRGWVQHPDGPWGQAANDPNWAERLSKLPAVPWRQVETSIRYEFNLGRGADA